MPGYEKASKAAAPSLKQVYLLAHCALDVLGRDYPATRIDCSELIAELTAVLGCRHEHDIDHLLETRDRGRSEPRGSAHV